MFLFPEIKRDTIKVQKWQIRESRREEGEEKKIRGRNGFRMTVTNGSSVSVTQAVRTGRARPGGGRGQARSTSS